ncbi:hypothetical protein EMIHUDRAFT_352205 [Emiliania huxleyi CCMP1516]|uniref:Uncharacterized protein n=2 Tax=Emiliania huxleyi TaxID=2903 RepID=A0A0D3IP02_EMIH1|nr:hypothetical protein EMIHUDRAFT_360254 [Emiliania huxleyi CCMP1516]XP_005765416.1 hypothetical protein EMIHUDRAFT_374258 [Emiliania huxleyi CCMP1516]XP_005773701.1 hypothetical protein EMIHUDRAFT_315883 [Emiliania huxleyi CCMP1516]XP_005785131.1 hypothetical protein EMIHUDRAFT_364288 [Emiliania huxleyi CCMP1516]XP_005786630.1 hypothetical protein EMIHUDRAFT_352205 [Emiliania huxleyi CCMP1516]EOD04556.1 hypothetical protein EMIHUDRAFT_360254 [Emiliania huxleyi CCMP1516]EOD12987.1 hypothetic|eukprot:XP_005756985.1 hypothetical protein EMIHUDRAFT_360254 [Emiliania huxleyi CCMP1516]
MCLSPALQSGEDIVSHQLELQSILHGVHQRYAGRQGRYNKHDTARLRYIKNTAFPGLRFGKMVPERDMAMLSPLPPSRIARHLASPQGHLSRRLHLSAVGAPVDAAAAATATVTARLIIDATLSGSEIRG